VARNAGLKAARGEIVAFMDDDCEADEDWLATLKECFTADIGLVCGSLEAPAKKHRGFAVCPQVVPDDVIYDPKVSGLLPPPGFRLLGANLAVRRALTKDVLFDECIGPGSPLRGSGEEHDYVYRLAHRGVRMRSTPRSIVRHTYGYRYGFRAVYAASKVYIRGNGALAAKLTLLRAYPGEVRLRQSLLEEAKHQLGTISLTRLPNSMFRLFHHLESYRECLLDYRLVDADGIDPSTAVLVHT
jgi:glycosyltransferase involved in cell wall biosynthesis